MAHIISSSSENNSYTHPRLNGSGSGESGFGVQGLQNFSGLREFRV